jgi:hypothetical protein
VSALLETVDLELERILEQREQYQQTLRTSPPTELLNVDLLARVLDTHLPAQNKDEIESYAELLVDLTYFSITTPEQLIEILTKHHDAILAHDAASVDAIRSDEELQALNEPDEDRLARGVFFTHVGLTRTALAFEYGDAWLQYRAASGDDYDEDVPE